MTFKVDSILDVLFISNFGIEIALDLFWNITRIFQNITRIFQICFGNLGIQNLDLFRSFQNFVLQIPTSFWKSTRNVNKIFVYIFFSLKQLPLLRGERVELLCKFSNFVSFFSIFENRNSNSIRIIRIVVDKFCDKIFVEQKNFDKHLGKFFEFWYFRFFFSRESSRKNKNGNKKKSKLFLLIENFENFIF